MALTLETITRNASCNAEVDLIDVGSTQTEGYVTILTSADAVLATLPCANPAFGAAAVGVATANAISPVAASATGTAAKYFVYDRNEAKLWEGTCGVGSGDMQLNTLSIVTSVQVAITSWTHTVAAS